MDFFKVETKPDAPLQQLKHSSDGAGKEKETKKGEKEGTKKSKEEGEVEEEEEEEEEETTEPARSFPPIRGGGVVVTATFTPKQGIFGLPARTKEGFSLLPSPTLPFLFSPLLPSPPPLLQRNQ
jgi:hypothetical protein